MNTPRLQKDEKKDLQMARGAHPAFEKTKGEMPSSQSSEQCTFNLQEDKGEKMLLSRKTTEGHPKHSGEWTGNLNLLEDRGDLLLSGRQRGYPDTQENKRDPQAQRIKRDPKFSGG